METFCNFVSKIYRSDIKMAKLTNTFFTLICLLSLGACSSDETNEKSIHFALSEDVKINPVSIKRLDNGIENYPKLSDEERQDFIRNNYKYLDTYGLLTDDIDTIDNITLLAWASSPVSTEFGREINKIFINLEDEEKSIGRVVETLKNNGLEVPVSDFVAVAWGVPQSIVIDSDKSNSAYIALNHYLGAEHPAYNNRPEYLRQNKRREMIPVDIAEAFVGTVYPFDDSQNSSVLSEILYEGALAVAKQAAVPNSPLSDILGFTPSQLKEITENEALMWDVLIKNNYLYSTDADVKSNLFDPRPNSTLISSDAPGRSVRYIGYNIVNQYIDKYPDTTLKQLLSPDFYNNPVEVLRKSGYSPKVGN